MSYVVRTRSFGDLCGYMDFVDKGMSPLTTIPLHAPLWRKMPRSQRTGLGRWMADRERLLMRGMAIALEIGRRWVGLRDRVLRGAAR